MPVLAWIRNWTHRWLERPWFDRVDALLVYSEGSRAVIEQVVGLPTTPFPLATNPDRFTEVSWAAEGDHSFRVELQVDGWDRTRLLEDLSRTFAESGINILEAKCTVVHPMVKNRFVVEVGDTAALKACVQRIRNIESVFDAYRVTPTG